MARVNPIPRDQMTDEQRSLNDAIAAHRSGGQAGGPYAIWLRNPALTAKAAALGNYLRHESSVPRRLSELAILVTARAWNSQYAWRSHEKHAKLAGLEMPIIDAIRHRRRPDFVHDTDIIVYELAAELNEARAISDATYARAVALLGEAAVIDLVTIIGFYSMVAMVVIAFQSDVPGVPPLPV